MKAVILAGGFGTRLSEETDRIPKPLVEIGGKPILWHIMKIYSRYGINDFIICLGYKGYLIKEYFAHYHLHTSDITVDVTSGNIEIHRTASEAWRVTLVDTGIDTMTGGRLKRIAHHLDAEPFCMTYGDGVSDVDIAALLAFHRSHGALATVTTVVPPGRWGAVKLDGTLVTGFEEKVVSNENRINGGFFVLDPKVMGYIAGDAITWEQEPMSALSRDGQLRAFKHDGFWQAMDTLRDKQVLESLWASGKAPWKL